MPFFRSFLIVFFLVSAALPPAAQARTLKVAHPYSDTSRDVRHRMLQVFARELAAVSPDLRVRLYPDGKLFGETELPDGLSAGTLEMALLSRARIEALVPELSPTPAQDPTADTECAPGSPFPGETGRGNLALQARGLKWLGGLWLPTAVFDRGGECRATPGDLAGARTLYLPFDAPMGLLKATSGALINRVADPQSASAGILPEVDLTDGQPLRLPEGACIVLQGANARLYDYVALVISLPAWMSLDEPQRAALTEAAAVATQYGVASLSRTLDAPEDRLTAVSQGGRLQARFQTPEEEATWLPRPHAPQDPREAEPLNAKDPATGSAAGTRDASTGSGGNGNGAAEPATATTTHGDPP
ncbi:hypothetical protein IHV25_08275 [Phaeovibrio sulfidiphilus]|uniref:Uncharacterized protein n=1 Tax=Phaeovibrio sulfidiphilus TaxID=1220600 RepID=A0A8J6YQS2_9PROT|nr:hypothetical protein [Phaeovibrio sulfidiphilus]MBE1237642.1 hypothetical protein [Phaeovibrio sulfidiphilus]